MWAPRGRSASRGASRSAHPALRCPTHAAHAARAVRRGPPAPGRVSPAGGCPRSRSALSLRPPVAIARIRRLRLAALTAALVLVLVLASPAAASAPSDDPLLPPAGTCAHELDVTATVDEQAAAMRCLVDGVRANAGLA